MNSASLLLAKRDLYLSHEQYSRLMDLYARYARFDDDTQFIAEAVREFGLEYYTEYRIIVESGRAREKGKI